MWFKLPFYLQLEYTYKLAMRKPIVCPTLKFPHDLGGDTRKVTQFWPKLGLKLLVEGIPNTERMCVVLQP